MLNKVAGLARTVAILIAIVAGIAPSMPAQVPLVLLLLGIIAGFAYSGDDFIRLVLTAVALPIAGAALSAVPTIGGNLAVIMTNVAIAVGGALATRIIIRLYEVVVGDFKSLGS